MLFTLLQTQNIGVLLFIVIYESCGVLKPRKKSFLVDKNSDMPTHCCVPLCTKIYRDKVTGEKYLKYLTSDFQRKKKGTWARPRFARGIVRLNISRLL